MKLTNKKGLSLPLVMLLSHSDYDKDPRENSISATTLLKPTKAIALGLASKSTNKQVDIMDLVPSVFGSAVHSFAESAWNDKDTVELALSAYGIEDNERVVINPETVSKDSLPIYIERRSERTINGYVIVGKFDCCIDGQLSDYKTCSTYSTIFKSNDNEYIMQASIYRWLNQDVVTSNTVEINKMYTDWSKKEALRDSRYPQERVETFSFQLLSVEGTERFIVTKLKEIDVALKLPQAEMQRCDDIELWKSDTKFKYYKKPGAARATKIYKSLEEAMLRKENEGVGEVRTFHGEVRRCKYCNVQPICDQSQEYIATGRLVI